MGSCVLSSTGSLKGDAIDFSEFSNSIGGLSSRGVEVLAAVSTSSCSYCRPCTTSGSIGAIPEIRGFSS